MDKFFQENEDNFNPLRINAMMSSSTRQHRPTLAKTKLTPEEDAFEKVVKKMTQHRDLILRNDDKNPKQREMTLFGNLPKYMRIMIKDNVLDSLNAQKGQKLSKIPLKWENQLYRSAGTNETRLPRFALEKYVKEDFNNAPSNSQNLDKFLQANDAINNPLSEWLNSDDPEKINCLMWYPNYRILVPVTHMTLFEEDGRFLEVDFKRPHINKNSLKSEKFSMQDYQLIQKLKEDFSTDYANKDYYRSKHKNSEEINDDEQLN